MGADICTGVKNQENGVGDQTVQIMRNQNYPQSSYAYRQPPKYPISCPTNHTLHSQPPITPPPTLPPGQQIDHSFYLPQHGVYYTGGWLQGRPQGPGTVVLPDGTVLRACFQGGAVVGGDSVFVMGDGGYYRGGVQKGLFHGDGVFWEPQGHCYQGLWDSNRPHGKGKETLANGDCYEGNFQHGTKCDPNAKYTWRNHPEIDRYQGNFSNGVISGQGKLFRKDGTVVQGFFRDASRIQDAHVYNKQVSYHGEIVNGKIEGQGSVEYLTTNKKYTGNFKNGLPHGFGTLTLPNGENKQGQWFEGALLTKQKGLSEEQIRKLLALIDQALETSDYKEDMTQYIGHCLEDYYKGKRFRVQVADLGKHGFDAHSSDLGHRTYSFNARSSDLNASDGADKRHDPMSDRFVVVDLNDCVVVIEEETKTVTTI